VAKLAAIEMLVLSAKLAEFVPKRPLLRRVGVSVVFAGPFNGAIQQEPSR
jgi:hypothetical protein